MGDVIVLAVEAHEVAARGGDGIGAGARQEVEQRLFLNGVDVLGNDSGVIEAVEGAVLVLPDVAEPPFARVNLALVGAQKALGAPMRNDVANHDHQQNVTGMV